MSGCLIAVGIFLMFVGLILDIVGIATPDWMVCEYEGKTCYFDLWNNTKCYDKKIQSVDPYEGEYPELTTVKVMVVSGLIAGALALLSAISQCAIDASLLKKIGCGAISVAFLADEIGGTVYGVGVKDGDYGDPEDDRPEKHEIEAAFYLGYSFYLCIVAGFAMAVGGGIFFCATCRESED